MTETLLKGSPDGTEGPENKSKVHELHVTREGAEGKGW